MYWGRTKQKPKGMVSFLRLLLQNVMVSYHFLTLRLWPSAILIALHYKPLEIIRIMMVMVMVVVILIVVLLSLSSTTLGRQWRSIHSFSRLLTLTYTDNNYKISPPFSLLLSLIHPHYGSAILSVLDA